MSVLSTIRTMTMLITANIARPQLFDVVGGELDSCHGSIGNLFTSATEY